MLPADREASIARWYRRHHVALSRSQTGVDVGGRVDLTLRRRYPHDLESRCDARQAHTEVASRQQLSFDNGATIVSAGDSRRPIGRTTHRIRGQNLWILHVGGSHEDHPEMKER